MKRFAVSLSFIAALVSVSLSVSTAIFASQAEQSKVRSFWNPVMIYNDAPYDIEYAFYSPTGGHFYFVERGKTDVYHSGVADKRVSLLVAACTEVNNQGKCVNVITHVAPGYYNAELIKAIHVNSVYDAKVMCYGGVASCMLK